MGKDEAGPGRRNSVLPLLEHLPESMDGPLQDLQNDSVKLFEQELPIALGFSIQMNFSKKDDMTSTVFEVTGSLGWDILH